MVIAWKRCQVKYVFHIAEVLSPVCRKRDTKAKDLSLAQRGGFSIKFWFGVGLVFGTRSP